ncbi:MAG: tetratricopeptide repeat protein [Myxococcota bacterium]
MGRPLNLRERGRWVEALDDGDPVERARALVLLGRLEEALAVAPPGVARAEALLARGDPLAALGETDDLLVHAHARIALGEPEAAFAPAARALAAADGDYDRAQARLALAEAHHRCGGLQDAEDAWRIAGEHLRAIDPDHRELGRVYDGLGNTLRKAGDLRGAVDCHRLAQRHHGDHPLGRAASLHALAQCQRRLGDFEGARASLREAARLTEPLLGGDHPDTWVTRFELARVEVDCGDYDGLQRMQDARDRVATLLGADHPTVRAMDVWL